MKQLPRGACDDRRGDELSRCQQSSDRLCGHLFLLFAAGIRDRAKPRRANYGLT
jgi:hypothetical protein